MYSNRSNTSDNDSGFEKNWVYAVNSTTTRLNIEYVSELVTQAIGVWVMWVEV